MRWYLFSKYVTFVTNLRRLSFAIEVATLGNLSNILKTANPAYFLQVNYRHPEPRAQGVDRHRLCTPSIERRSKTTGVMQQLKMGMFDL